MTRAHLRRPVSFGIKTAPQGAATWPDILRTWQDADAEPLIEHAWLWDHLMPLGLAPDEPCLENWTLLAALAARTERLRLGHLVASTLNHPPAVLAKMAATIDIISGGRLVLGLGAGWASPEQEAYGVPYLEPRDRIDRLDEACRIIRGMWTQDAVDFDGRHFRIRGARLEPKPVQRPHPPILIGGAGERRTLRVAAEHADIWNLSARAEHGPAELRRLNGVLDEHCAAIGREPSSIARSVQLFAELDDPAATRRLAAAFVDAGADQVVLNLRAPLAPGAVRVLVDEIVRPLHDAGPRPS